jgi:DNA-binding response OmpR family regulator
MKVLFLGNDLLAQRIMTVLTRENIKVTYLKEPSLAIRHLKKKKCDLVIVDSLLSNVEKICYDICGLCCVPLILMVDESRVSWKTLSNIDTDGFISEDASDNELLVRVNALCRRYRLKTQKTI